MKRILLTIFIISVFLIPPPAFSDSVSEYNATITSNDIFYMREPSFVGRDFGIFEMGGVGNKVIVLSRTSFTDRMAGVPEDHWYLVMYRHCGAELTGYIHGSAIRMDPGRSVPVFDPPGASPTSAVPAFERFTVGASIDRECKKTAGTLTVPPGERAVRFRLNYFNGDYAECQGGSVWPARGFFIAPASGPGNPSFVYEEPEDPGPDGFDSVRDRFLALELGPGEYLVDVAGRPTVYLKITCDLVEVP